MSNLDYKPSYRRNLPHLQLPGAIMFLTFRLDGSLPREIVENWKKERAWLERLAESNPLDFDSEYRKFEKRWFAKFENLLDSGSHGPLWLKDPTLAKLVADSLHYRDGRVFRLDCYSIMPNHVHAVFKPLPCSQGNQELGTDEDYYSLGSIMQSLKGYTAFKCNRILKRKGQFWAHESYDHVVRNNAEWNRIVKYVLNNPVKAGLVTDQGQWPWNYVRKSA